MHRMEFVEALGDIYGRLGRPVLEGRFAALLLAYGPTTLSAAAQRLGVNKVTLSRVANRMLELQDVKRSVAKGTREHLYELVDHAYSRDLSERQRLSGQIAELTQELARASANADDRMLTTLRHHAELHRIVADSLGRIMQPEEKLKAQDIREHYRSNWDAVPPKTVAVPEEA